MEVCRRNFPEIMNDNDEAYIQHTIGVIESVDELSNVEIFKTPHSYHFRIAPSMPVYLEPILKEVINLNNMFGIRLSLSKSMKASATVTFDVLLQ